MPLVPTNFAFMPSDPAPSAGGPAIPSMLVNFAKAVLRAWQLLTTVINGQVSFGNGVASDNISGVWATVADTGAANTDFTITHNLGRIPVGYLVMTSSIATDIYTGSVAATKTQITLRSSAAHAAITLFIL
jgi:hypothetical protein